MARSNESETGSDPESGTSADPSTAAAIVFAFAFAFSFALLLGVPLCEFRAVDHADELADDAGDAVADGAVFVVQEGDPACCDEPEFSVSRKKKCKQMGATRIRMKKKNELDASTTTSFPDFPHAKRSQTELINGNGELLALGEEKDPHARDYISPGKSRSAPQ